MSSIPIEKQLDREPVEIVEIITPKCANTFGALPCRAGLGTVSDDSQNFRDGLGSWVPGQATASDIDGGQRFTATVINNWIDNTSLSFDGSAFRYVTVKGKWVSGGQRVLYLSWESGGPNAIFSGGQVAAPVNTSDAYRGFKATDDLVAGDDFFLIFDLNDVTNYATDWDGQTISRMFLNLFGAGSLAVYDLYEVTFHSADPRDSLGSECFNTRATCQDTDNFQARPLANLTPDAIYNAGDTATTANTGFDNYIVTADVFVPIDPAGLIFKIGGTGLGIFLGFTDGELVARTGGGATLDPLPTTAARVAVDAAAYEGRTLTLVMVLTKDGSSNNQVSLYEFDPIELELTLIGSASASASDDHFGGGDTSCGTLSANAPAGEDGADYNGTIDSVRVYDDQTAALFPDADAYRTRYFFDDGRKARCSDAVYILPLLINTSAVGSRINITGNDDRYEPLGRRAFFECQIADAPHSDYPFDQYRTGRLYNALQRSTFWRKWIAREKFGRTRALVRRYTGYNGQALADMRRQTYVFDRVKRSGDKVSISSRDVLSLTEFRRAQVPAPTDGVLDVALTDAATSLFLAGDKTAQYPAVGGTIRINDELMTYTAAAYDGVDDQTDITGLTRGTDGSTAQAHDVDDGVQLCRRYTADSVSDVLTEFLVTDAAIPAQLVNVDKIITEDAQSLSAYSLTTVISTPTGVDRLIGELAESCTFYIWWDERDQMVDMQAIKPLSGVDASFSDEANIVGDSLTIEERPKERISTLVLSYNPRDFAGDLDNPSNFKVQDIFASSENNDVDQYAKLPQTREVFSRWLTTNAQVAQTGARYINRYIDVPIYVAHKIDAKDGALWLGDFVTLSTEDIVTAAGERDVRRFVVIEAEEPEAGHNQKIVLADVTLDGQIYVITENGIGTYTAALFGAGNAFITDNSGLNPDGTVGATIG